MNRILRNNALSVDEIVVDNCTVHIEQMDVGSYWIGITDAEGHDIAVNLVTNRTRITPIHCSVDDGDDGWVWDEDRTHPA